MSFVFLICTERSGSNFLTNLIGGHNNFSAPPPTHLFRLFGTNEENYGDLTTEANWLTLAADVVENFNCKLGLWNTTVTVEELMTEITDRKSSELLRYIYQKEADSEGAENIFVKENHTYTFADYLLTYFKDSKLIYMVRDPRDVASSWVHTDTIPGGVEKAVNTWIEDQQEACKLLDRLIVQAHEKIYLLKYEDLVSNTVTCLTKLMNFLGAEYDDETLEYYKNPRTVANANRIEAWKNLSKPVMQSNFGKYKDKLSSTDILYIELRCEKLMSRFGYCPESTEKPLVFSNSEIETKITELNKNISPGIYKITDDAESEIRNQRLNAINKVLQRRL